MQECVTILSNAADGVYDLAQTLKTDALTEDCRSDLKRLSDIQREAVEGLSKESMEFYFKTLDSGKTCTASLLGCFRFKHSSDGKTDQLADEEAFFDTLTLADRLDAQCEETEASDEQKLAEFTDYMKTMQIKDALRWQIFSALLHPGEHKEKIFGLLRHVRGNLARHETELGEIFRRRRAEIVMKDQEKSIETIIIEQSSYQISGEIFPEEMIVTLYDPFSLRGRICPHRESYFTIGAFFPYHPEPLSRKKMEKKDVMMYGKILADGNKLEILRLLSHKTYINKELADALKLSTATISYHMSVLTELELVNTTVSANKIIYELNRKKMEDVMNRLTEYFDHLEQQRMNNSNK